MSNRIFACAVAAPMCLIATPLVADVMFDNTLDGTRATNPNAQSTFSFTNGNARAFAFKIDDGFDFNLFDHDLFDYDLTSAKLGSSFCSLLGHVLWPLLHGHQPLWFLIHGY